MALTKVTGSGVEGITNLSNATFLSVDASEVATLLTSAVINSEGGAVTTNIAQGLCKAWINTSADGTTINESFNVTSMADTSTGRQTITIASDMANANYTVQVHVGENVNKFTRIDSQATGSVQTNMFAANVSGYVDVKQQVIIHGDLA